jgi:hypothetical protein
MLMIKPVIGNELEEKIELLDLKKNCREYMVGCGQTCLRNQKITMRNY